MEKPISVVFEALMTKGTYKVEAKREAERIRKAKYRARKNTGIGFWGLRIPYSLISDGLVAGRWLPRKDSNDRAKVLSALHRFVTAAMTKQISNAKEADVPRDNNNLNRDAQFAEMLRRESRKEKTC